MKSGKLSKVGKRGRLQVGQTKSENFVCQICGISCSSRKPRTNFNL